MVACADISSNFMDGILRCGIALLGSFGFCCILLALCGSWTSLMASITLLACTTIIGEAQTLCIWSLCEKFVQNDDVDATFVNEEGTRANRSYAKRSQTLEHLFIVRI